MENFRKRKTMVIKATVSSETFEFFHDFLGFEYIDDFLEVIIRDSTEFKDFLKVKSQDV